MNQQQVPELRTGLVILALACFLMAAMMTMQVSTMQQILADPALLAKAQSHMGTTVGVLRFLLWLAAAADLLLVVTGIGLLRRSKILGRWAGTAYAAVALVNAAVNVFLTKDVSAWWILPAVAFPGIVLAFVHGRYRPILVRVP